MSHTAIQFSHSPSNCDGNCLRLLQFYSTSIDQELTVHGITLNEPPFNSFVVFGDVNTYATHVANYKQVGGWYYQTDGVEAYTGGAIKNAFFHANDDVIKMYHSNTSAENIVVWKGANGPVIQFGWASRHISNLLVKDVDVIHNLMYWKDQKDNTCIINSTGLNENPTEEDKVSLSHTISNVEFKNIRAEGKNLCAMRFIALSNWDSIRINGLEIEEWNDLSTDSQLSLFRAEAVAGEPQKQVAIGVGARGLHIENYTVAGNPILKSDDSWKSNSNGRLDFSNDFSPHWLASSTQAPQCIPQTISFSPPANIIAASLETLTATASSGLPVTFRLVAGEGSISGNLLTTSDAKGLIAIAAQAGNSIYCSTNVVRLINVAAGLWIGGSWSSWRLDDIPMVWNSTEKLFQAMVVLPVGAQQLKFANTNNWTGDDWGNGSGFSGTAKQTTGGGGNISFNVSVAGSYLIKFNPQTFAYSIVKS